MSQKDLAASLQSTSTETVSTMSDFDSAFQKFLIENCPSTDNTTPTRIIITVDNGSGPVVEETVDVLPAGGASGENVHVDTNIEQELNLQTINSDDIGNSGMNEGDDEPFEDDLYVAEKAVVSTLNHPYACIECNKIYQTRRQLYMHNWAKHGSSVFRCGVCRKEFKRPTNLKGHMVVVHSQQCPKCDTINIENGVWAENTKRTDERQIACTGCGEILTMRSKHGPQHKHVTKEGGGFVRIGSMVKCTECGKLFTRESAYKRHSILHMAEKPHHCHLCVKSFTLRATLRSHLRMFHPYAPIPEIP